VQRQKLFISLLVLFFCCGIGDASFSLVLAETTITENITKNTTAGIENTAASIKEINFSESSPQDIFPLSKTKIELRKQNITLDWSEKTTTVLGAYSLVNPGKTKIKLKIGLPKLSPSLKVYGNEEEIKTNYNASLNAYVWELKLNPEEEVTLKTSYLLLNETNEQGVFKTGYRFNPAKSALWANASPAFSLTLNFHDTHPGQILNITPRKYQFQGDSLVWEQGFQQPKEDILITANLQAEINSWQNQLSATEQKQFFELTSQEQNLETAAFLEKISREAKNTEEKRLLKLGQAYYLEKAGLSKKALSLFSDLVDYEEPYPRAYWELGKASNQHPGKLLTLLSQIRDLQIHPLLQPWLITKLPPEKIKLSPPEITIKYTDTNKTRKGINIKSHLTDKDGDIAQITLYYHWEGEQEETVELPTQPFNYTYEPLYFTAAPGPFKRLFYEIKATDYAGHEVTSGKKEVFYLDENFQSETFILDGANLILADYSRHEQNKVYGWFKSYLKIAKEVGFVPIKAKSPLFIFMGKNHEFIKDYQGVLFMYYTPTPFSPNSTRIPVHRYFLSSWYGSSWNTISENELITFGDALLLGKNWYTNVFRYLLKKDDKLFSNLLCQIGEGKSWSDALMSCYQLTPLQLHLLTIWQLIGNYVIALVIIICFAWLGKNGYITKLLQFFTTEKK